MAEAATKLPIKTATTPVTQPAKAADWQPFDVLRNQVDRLFHDFQTGFLQAPFLRPFPDISPSGAVTLASTSRRRSISSRRTRPSKSRPNCLGSMPRTSTFSLPTAC